MKVSGGPERIRTPTVLVLSESPPAIGLQIHEGFLPLSVYRTRQRNVSEILPPHSRSCLGMR